MARWTLGFLVGVMLLTTFSHLPSVKIAWCFIAAIVILVSYLISQRISFSYWIPWVAFSLGFSWALINAHHRVNHQLPKVLEGQTLIARGRIMTIPENRKHYLRFVFLIESLATRVPVNYPLQVHLNWYYAKHASQRPLLKKGDIWQFALRLKRPRAFWSPGSFDYQAELFRQNIQATGYIVDKLPFYLIQPASPYDFISRLREKLIHNIKQSLASYPLVGLISALTTGVRYEISDTQWQVMRGTGTNHLFAISGLHLAFIAGIIYGLVRFVCCRLPYIALWIPASQIAAVLTLLFAIFYSALAGFALPTQRALLMLSIVIVAALQRRHLASWHSFHLALLLILIVTPFSVLSSSFWLSFMAVAFIFYTVSGRIKPLKGWRAWLRIQFAVGLGLIPLSLLFFHQISWASFVANLIAIPWIGFLILPLSLLGSLMTLLTLSGGSQLLVLAERLLELLWHLLTYLSAVSWFQYYSFVATPWLLWVSLVGLFMLLAPKGIPARWLGVFWVLPLFFWKPEGPKSGEVWLSLLDVGQGLAVIVRTQHHVLVYDTGPRLSASFDAGSTVLLPFLQKAGIQTIDRLMISHGDNDHSGGADAILRQMPVESIVSSIPKKFLPNIVSLCQEKVSWQWDGANFEVMYPPVHHTYSGNNSSCVVRISSLTQSILLVGDIERKAENYLVNTRNTDLASTVLVVPHHGSKTSSGIEFLNKVQPLYALFSTGYRNRFKFPHKVVLKRYERLNAKIYNTAVEGTITLKLDATSSDIQIETYRQKYHRFWLD